MSDSIFEKWNQSVDPNLANEVDEVKKNGGTGDYKEVPHGDYTVKVDKMELKESKTGKPMLTVWFKILEGEFKNSMIFMNQVIQQAFQIHKANEFLESLDSGVEVKFDGNYAHYNGTILDISEAIEGLEYLMTYDENNKGYSTFEIVEVYDA